MSLKEYIIKLSTPNSGKFYVDGDLLFIKSNDSEIQTIICIGDVKRVFAVHKRKENYKGREYSIYAIEYQTQNNTVSEFKLRFNSYSEKDMKEIFELIQHYAELQKKKALFMKYVAADPVSDPTSLWTRVEKTYEFLNELK